MKFKFYELQLQLIIKLSFQKNIISLSFSFFTSCLNVIFRAVERIRQDQEAFVISSYVRRSLNAVNDKRKVSMSCACFKGRNKNVQ